MPRARFSMLLAGDDDGLSGLGALAALGGSGSSSSSFLALPGVPAVASDVDASIAGSPLRRSRPSQATTGAVPASSPAPIDKQRRTSTTPTPPVKQKTAAQLASDAKACNECVNNATAAIGLFLKSTTPKDLVLSTASLQKSFTAICKKNAKMLTEAEFLTDATDEYLAAGQARLIKTVVNNYSCVLFFCFFVIAYFC